MMLHVMKDLTIHVPQNDTVEVKFWAGNPRNNLMVTHHQYYSLLSYCSLHQYCSLQLYVYVNMTDCIFSVYCYCFQTEKTFLTVEKKSASGMWSVVCTDACWETRSGSRSLLTLILLNFLSHSFVIF